MILQEWPTAWNSHDVQPPDLLEETVRHTTLRIRNHPSLVMYGAGNESNKPFGPSINMMGRHSIELDGTRPFHRAEPWGGSMHNYDVYWGRQPLDKWLSMKELFIGEFGVASLPSLESTLKFLPAEEHDVWPPRADGSLAHRMPVFNKKAGMSIHAQYVGDWVPNDSLGNFILGIQMTQATGMRHVVELNRTRWPEATGICYYKLNDNNPASAWSTVDWYGAPKIAYHILQQAYAPLHACVLFPAHVPWQGNRWSCRYSCWTMPSTLSAATGRCAYAPSASTWRRSRCRSSGAWRNHGSKSGSWAS